MPVGQQPSQGSVNQTLTNLALQWRDLAQQSVQQREYLNSLGAAGLEAINFTAQDAATVLLLIDYMGTVADVYHGVATQATTFNFENALTSLWAGS